MKITKAVARQRIGERVGGRFQVGFDFVVTSSRLDTSSAPGPPPPALIHESLREHFEFYEGAAREGEATESITIW